MCDDSSAACSKDARVEFVILTNCLMHDCKMGPLLIDFFDGEMPPPSLPFLGGVVEEPSGDDC